MKCIILITAVTLVSVSAVFTDPLKHKRPNTALDPIRNAHQGSERNQNKRGLPTYSKGYDIPVVRHTLLKPLLLKYPTQAVPIGLKIPLRPPNRFNYPTGRRPHTTYGANIPPIQQRPTVLHPTTFRPSWPTNCAPTHHPPPIIAPAPVAPIAPVAPAIPVIPTTTVQVSPAAVPPPVFAQVLPLPQPPVTFIPKPILKPLIPFVPTAPVVPAVAPAILKPGNSLHTSFFATFPRHKFIPGVHVAHLAPAAPIAPIAPISPIAPLAPIAPLTPIVPATPVSHLFPGSHFPINIHTPFNVGRIPINVFHPIKKIPTVLNQIPVATQQPLPITHPLHGQIPFATQQPLPIAHPLHGQIPLSNFPSQTFHTVEQSDAGNVGQPAFNFPKPNLQFSSHSFINTNDNVNVQEQTINHGLQNFPDSNVWTPMTTPVAPSGSNFDAQHNFIQQSFGLPDDQQNLEHQGYHYQQPEQGFEDPYQGQQQEVYHNGHFSSNIQHEPQLPQALPDHPLAGRPINEAFQNHIPLRQHLPLDQPMESFADYQ